MKKLNPAWSAGALALTLCSLGATQAGAQTSPLIPGDLAVVIYGKVNTPLANKTFLDGDPTPLSIAQFPTTISAGVDNVTPDLLETLPTTGTGTNVGIVGEYGSSSEGTILVSGDGLSLTVGGYDGNADAVGGPYGDSGNGTALAQSTSADVPRTGALINIATGTVNTSTAFNNIYNTNNTRGVYTQNGTSFYLSGQGAGVGDEGGLYLTNVGNNNTAGGTSATAIFNVVSTRMVTEATIDAAHGVATTTPNLYYSADQNSSKKGTQTGMFEYPGLPTTSEGSNTGTRLTPVSGTVNGVSVNFSPEGFFFANATTLYIADTGDPKAGGNGDGGIQKWSFNGAGNVWVLDYTLAFNFKALNASTTETGFESLAGQVVNGQVNLYATSYTTADDAPDGLYGVTDTLSATTLPGGEAVVQLAASTTDMDFKGVAIVPSAPASPLSEPTMPVWGLGLLGVALVAVAARFMPKTERA